MYLLAHESEAHAQESAMQLRGLGRYVRKLLEECVAAQGVERASLSRAAEALSEAGFVFVRGGGTVFEPRFLLAPSLAGEEALEALERMECQERGVAAPARGAAI